MSRGPLGILVGCPQDDNGCTARALLRRRQEDRRRSEELHVGDFSGEADALEFALFAARAACKAHQVLIVEMLLYLIEIGAQRDGALDAKIVGFRAGFFRKLAEIGLSVEDAEIAAADVATARIIDGPDVDVPLLSVFDGGVEVRVKGIEAAAKIVDARRNHDDGRAVVAGGGRPTLDPILDRKIGTGESAQPA